MISLVLGCLALWAGSTSSQLVETGQTVVLNGIPYYIPPKPVATLPKGGNYGGYGGYGGYGSSSFKAGTLTPITVVDAKSTKYGDGDLQATLKRYKQKDDVWQAGFLGGLYIQYSGSYYSCPRSPRFGSLPKGSPVITSCHVTQSKSIPHGPYFVKDGALYAAYRMYSDVQGVFTEPLVANPDGSFSVASCYTAGQSLTVPVPSRLYYKKTNSKPLAGVRLIVKDIYDLKGIKTGDGNRAWYNFYPAANTTAPAVQNLIDAGAIVIGKVKTSQFANGETATADWVDYHSPFNPRGDGYQDPSSSSSGPGAGEGAYDWCDLGLGSDTGGSIRGPSQVQGLYGNRPSHGLVSLDHVMPLAPELDTAGLLTRDPKLWAAGAKALYKENITFTRTYPTKILTTGFPTTKDNQADTLILEFLDKLTKFLGGKVQTFNLTAAWIANPPSQNAPLPAQYFNLTYPILISQEQIKLVRDPFYAAYGAAHDGRRPFVDPVPLARWAFGESSTETIARAQANQTVFKNWFAKNVLKADKKTCSDSLLLYVGSDAEPFTRNQYISPPRAPTGFGVGRISPFWGGPDFVLPIGQATYFSDVTQHDEVLPVTIDILAATGCDGMLFSLALDLEKAGILKAQKAGGSNVDGGEILYRRF